MGKILEENEEGITAMKKADYFYSTIIPQANVETQFLSNFEVFRKTEEMFLSELKKYYCIE